MVSLKLALSSVLINSSPSLTEMIIVSASLKENNDQVEHFKSCEFSRPGERRMYAGTKMHYVC